MQNKPLQPANEFYPSDIGDRAEITRLLGPWHQIFSGPVTLGPGDLKPLHLAAGVKGGLSKTISLLDVHKVDINALTDTGSSAMQLAAIHDNYNTAIALILRGADTSTTIGMSGLSEQMNELLQLDQASLVERARASGVEGIVPAGL